MSKEARPILVIQYEQFFEGPIRDLGGTIDRVLEAMREEGGGRVVGSYSTVDDDEFRQKAVFSIRINQPMEFEVDR